MGKGWYGIVLYGSELLDVLAGTAWEGGLTMNDCITMGVRLVSCKGCDRVEVVHCMDCRNYDLEARRCKFWPDEGYRSPDHYCAEGKRRENQ